MEMRDPSRLKRIDWGFGVIMQWFGSFSVELTDPFWQQDNNSLDARGSSKLGKEADVSISKTQKLPLRQNIQFKPQGSSRKEHSMKTQKLCWYINTATNSMEIWNYAKAKVIVLYYIIAQYIPLEWKYGIMKVARMAKSWALAYFKN